MTKKRKEDIFISDSGVMIDHTYKKVTFFVISCRFMSVVLAILGIAAIIEGYF